MFGLSLAKLLLLGAVVATVWYGFKYLSRNGDEGKPRPARNSAASQPQGGAPKAIEDMVRCGVCGAFQTRGAGPCERPDCPQRR